MPDGGHESSAKRRYSLSVFLPCYNEQENVRRVVGEVMAFLPAVSDDFELIIVDDGSRDETGRIADELARADERIRVVHHERNLGYGAALRSGFRAAGKELVFYTDGDGQFDITDLAKLLPLIDRYDIVSGYRLKRRDGPIRRLNACLWGLLVRRLLGLRCRDVDSAFKLYRREIFDRMELKSTGALIDAEILARATRAGRTLIEVPVTHRPRAAGKQTGANLKVILRALRELLKLRKAILAADRANR
ncbi:MAG: glycosyltransferase family 2 protein [Planctomycetes bacterium]|nr:glycosyltransferase family 2 protein [Planctomycetota bacterium]